MSQSFTGIPNIGMVEEIFILINPLKKLFKLSPIESKISGVSWNTIAFWRKQNTNRGKI